MKKKITSLHQITITLLMLCTSFNAFSLNYTISFTGTGASTSVGSVIVQNLTKGTSVTVTSGNVLNLSDGISSVSNPSESAVGINIYPNPMQEKSTVSFFAKQKGTTQINVYGLDGRKIIGLSKNLLQGNNSFQLSIPQGTYVLEIKGNGVSYNAKVVSQTNYQAKPQISFLGDNQSINKPQKSKSAVVTMLYDDGDQLLYKGISGNYTTIITDIPTSSKTTNFDFVECKDGDGNYYAVVKIGTQTWMAENLKTTKYNTNELISNITDGTTWSNLLSSGYCWFENNINNKNTYGALYNWTAVHSGKLAPTNWHVPTYADWTTIIDFLSTNGYNYEGSFSGNYCAKSLAATTNWTTSTRVGVIGNDLGKNNKTGFTGLPGGYRSYTGSFDNIGLIGEWWSSDNNGGDLIWNCKLTYSESQPNLNTTSRLLGLSVRCIKN